MNNESAAKFLARTSLIRQEVQNSLVSWLGAVNWDLAVTFTFVDELTREQAEAVIKHYWNKVDRKLFKNAAKNYNKKCSRFCFVEGGTSGRRVHYHMGVKTPDGMTTKRFASLLQIYWEEMREAGRTEFKPMNSIEGWIGYSAKGVTTFSTDNLDIRNTHIAGRNF